MSQGHGKSDVFAVPQWRSLLSIITSAVEGYLHSEPLLGCVISPHLEQCSTAKYSKLINDQKWKQLKMDLFAPTRDLTWACRTQSPQDIVQRTALLSSTWAKAMQVYGNAFKCCQSPHKTMAWTTRYLLESQVQLSILGSQHRKPRVGLSKASCRLRDKQNREQKMRNSQVTKQTEKLCLAVLHVVIL